jgi:hypothetical protein
MRDPVPTEQQRSELCRLLHHVLVQIRFYGYHEKVTQMTDLADAFHNLPIEMIGDQGIHWDWLRGDIQKYEMKYKGNLSGINLIDEIDRIRKLEPDSPPNDSPSVVDKTSP